MLEGESIPKKNALMQLFNKRTPQPIVQPKPTKKIKPNQQRQDDPLYKLLSWRDEYVDFTLPEEGTYKIVKEESLPKTDQQKWGSKVQGIFANIDWETTSIDELEKLRLSDSLIDNGIVFIWGDKSNIGALMDYMEKMDFFYVENFIFVLLNRAKIPEKSLKKGSSNGNILNFFKPAASQQENKCPNTSKQQASQKDYETGKVEKVHDIFCNSDSEYFKQSQKVLYMFRKVAKNQALQLRHQRTSDVFFTIGDSLKLDWKSKQTVYKMIETLLISANYKSGKPLQLLELWGEESKPRKGWITVVEEKGSETKCPNSSQDPSDSESKQ